MNGQRRTTFLQSREGETLNDATAGQEPHPFWQRRVGFCFPPWQGFRRDLETDCQAIRPPRRTRRARRNQETKRLMPSFRLMLFKLISRPIVTRESIMSFNHLIGMVVEFHLRALRVLRGVSLPNTRFAVLHFLSKTVKQSHGLKGKLTECAAEPATKSCEQGLRIDDDFCMTYGSR